MGISDVAVYRQQFDSSITSQGFSGMHTNEQGRNFKCAEKLWEHSQYGGDCFSSESSGTTCKALFRMLDYALQRIRKSVPCLKAADKHRVCTGHA